jgi:hypothetical protein
VGLWGSDSTQRNLEFSFSWSAARQVGPDAIRQVSFATNRRMVILGAVRQMRAREPVEPFELRGPVVKLERAEESAVGKVTVMGLIEGRQLRVVVELESDEYSKAVIAHDRIQIVRMSGTLRREGRGLVLQEPGKLTIEEDTSDHEAEMD